MSGRLSLSMHRALQLVRAGKVTPYRAAQIAGVSRPALYRAIKRLGVIVPARDGGTGQPGSAGSP